MIHDYIKKSQVGRSIFPKIKGHLKIELKDVRTGRTDIAFEGDNMITNALKDIFASNYCGALDYRKLLPLYSKMLGGVLCFRNALDVSSADAADDYFIPDDSVNELIAHAGQTVFADQADDIKRGNPLNTSMVVTDGAVTLAYEWGSAGGNGVISSVALTHSDVGDAGTGSNSNAFRSMVPVINANFNDYTNKNAMWTHAASQADNMVFFVGIDGYGYRFTANGTTVTLIRIPLAYKKTGLVAEHPFVDGDSIKTQTITTDTNYNISSYGNPYYCYVEETNRLWIFYSTSNGRSVKVEEINLADWGMTNWHATNHDSEFSNLGANIMALYNNHPSLVLPYSNGSVYLPKTAVAALDYIVSGFLRVNLTSTADQSELTANVVPLGGVFPTSAARRIIAGKQFVINNGSLYPCTTGDVYGGSEIRNVNNFPFLDQKKGLANLCGQYGYNNPANQSYYVAVSKFYLGTKFNLPTPIQKSNTQSMVITYTLTEVEEES